MRLTEREDPKHMRGEAFEELEGVGIWMRSW